MARDFLHLHKNSQFNILDMNKAFEKYNSEEADLLDRFLTAHNFRSMFGIYHRTSGSSISVIGSIHLRQHFSNILSSTKITVQ